MDLRAGRGPSLEKRHWFYWQAATADFDFGVNRLGPGYRQGLDIHLEAFRSAMAGLPAPGTQGQVAQARQLMRTLAQEACSDSQLIHAIVCDRCAIHSPLAVPSHQGRLHRVAPLAHFLAGTGLMDSLSALLEGESQAIAHAKRRDSAEAWAARWLSGVSASETFEAE